MNKRRTLIRGVVYCGVVASVLAWNAPHATAAYMNVFDSLRAELVTRSLALSNSTDKVDQKHKKALDSAIKAIDKPAKDLSGDIKTAGKIAKSLAKAFPDDFPTNTTVSVMSPGAPKIVGSTLLELLQDVFDSFDTIIGDALDQLTTIVDGLPDSKNTDKAWAAIAKAEDALADAENANDLNGPVKALSAAFKSLIAGQKAAAKAAGGGGGGGGTCSPITTSSVTMTASNDSFSATSTFPGFAGGEYTQSTKTFSVGGTDGVTGNAVGFTVGSGVTGPGTYTANIGGSYTVGSPPTQVFNITSGSMAINGLNLTAQTACGTGTFTASDGVHVIVVNDFTFAIKNLGVSP